MNAPTADRTCEICQEFKPGVRNHVAHLDANAAWCCPECFDRWLDGRTPERALAEESGDLVTVALPRKWADDALERGLSIGSVVRRSARLVVLECAPSELREAYSDALYYADPCGFDSAVSDVCRSARAAVRRLWPLVKADLR